MYYENYPFFMRRSMRKSMKQLSLDFLIQYEFQMEQFYDEDTLINTLYFEWLQRSSQHHYHWTKRENMDVFSESFANEMKQRLRFYFFDLFYRKKPEQFRSFMKKSKQTVSLL